MRPMTFRQADTSKGHLILVNSSHPTLHDTPKNQLVPVCRNFAQIRLERQVAKMLAEIIARLGCEGEIIPVSGYRTMHEQKDIYAETMRTHGNDFTQQYVALPGCSEHQTGLAIDLAEKKDDIDFLRPNFPEDGICQRFRSLCSQFGFIERYPAGCEEITGIAHEPWHFRYVGYPHSEIIREKAITLEEYTDNLKQYLYEGDHLRWKGFQQDFEIFYIPVGENTETVIEVSDNIHFQASGNNENGVVMTLWRDRR